MENYKNQFCLILVVKCIKSLQTQGMIAINEPMGRFVALANLEKGMFSQKAIEQDVANLTNSMKTLSATWELENKIFYKTSKEGFFQMVNN